MSSPLLDYLSVQTIFSVASLTTPVIKPLIDDLVKFVIKPIAEKIRRSPDVPAEDKQVKIKTFVKSLVKHVIMLALMFLVWKIIVFVLNLIASRK